MFACDNFREAITGIRKLTREEYRSTWNSVIGAEWKEGGLEGLGCDIFCLWDACTFRVFIFLGNDGVCLWPQRIRIPHLGLYHQFQHHT